MVGAAHLLSQANYRLQAQVGAVVGRNPATTACKAYPVTTSWPGRRKWLQPSSTAAPCTGLRQPCQLCRHVEGTCLAAAAGTRLKQDQEAIPYALIWPAARTRSAHSNADRRRCRHVGRQEERSELLCAVRLACGCVPPVLHHFQTACSSCRVAMRTQPPACWRCHAPNTPVYLRSTDSQLAFMHSCRAGAAGNGAC